MNNYLLTLPLNKVSESVRLFEFRNFPIDLHYADHPLLELLRRPEKLGGPGADHNVSTFC